MNFIAHRGLYDNDTGENTLSAFDAAFANGYMGIELDVRKTKDDKIVVIHDSFISRVSYGFGLVKNFTYNELLKYNFGKRAVERIPLLSEVLKKYHNKVIIIELKEKISLNDLELNDQNDYYITSFHFDYVNDIPKSSKYKRGIINYVFNTNIDLSKIDFIMMLDSLVTDEVYDFYTNKGIEVIIYGINNKISLNLELSKLEKIKYIV